MRVGSWTDCQLNVAHPRVSMKFFRTTTRPNHVKNICDLCWFEIKKRNGTISTTPAPILKGKNPDSKPERDSL